MESHPKLLTTAEEIAALASKLRTQAMIAFDTEFIRENTFYPVVEIIQVATEEESWLVDAQHFKKGHRQGPEGGFDPALRPLLEVFEDKNILKIVHAAQGDQECLYTGFGVLASPILDTAVAASLCGFGDSIGLGKLLKTVLDISIAKGHARTNWSARPLPEQLIEYAHADVIHLVRVAKELLSRLEKVGRRDWALELSSKWEDRSLYEPDVEGLAHRLARGGRLDKKGYAALLGLIQWREVRVRQLNLPRRWVADDAVLIDLAHVRPKDITHLSAFRGLNKGEIKNSGDAILEAIMKAADAENVVAPKFARAEAPTPEESQVLDVLKCYVGILADQHRIAAKHLTTAAQLLPLLRRKIETQQDLVKAGVLSETAAKLIGNELIAFIHGRRALAVQDGHIKVIETKE